jgi:hypothetical protein
MDVKSNSDRIPGFQLSPIQRDNRGEESKKREKGSHRIKLSAIIVAPKPSVEKKQTPKQVFERLGSRDWWKVYIPEKLGKYAFADKEPDYLGGLFNAYRCAGKYLEICTKVPPTIRFYKQLHKEACEHLDPQDFKRKPFYEGSFQNFFPLLREDDLDKLKKDADLVALGVSNPEEPQEVADAQERVEAFGKIVKEKINRINLDIAKRSEELELPPLAQVNLIEKSYPWTVRLEYQCKDIESTLEKLFGRFWRMISKAKSGDEIDMVIGDFYQLLKWTRPFDYGQGRVDLLFLSTLLCQYGRNPAILDLPYYSSWIPLQGWTVYLQKGIDKWKEMVQNQNNMGKFSVQKSVTRSQSDSTPPSVKESLFRSSSN